MKKRPYNSSNPLLIDEDGLYITAGQMRYWLNRKEGRDFCKSTASRHPTSTFDFFRYYDSCRTYNLVSDLMEEEPDCAFLYWDAEKEAPAFSFPTSGTVAYEFTKLGLLDRTREDE